MTQNDPSYRHKGHLGRFFGIFQGGNVLEMTQNDLLYLDRRDFSQFRGILIKILGISGGEMSQNDLAYHTEVIFSQLGGILGQNRCIKMTFLPFVWVR